MYESTGLNGQSKVKILDPETMKEKKRWDIPREYFGEGCTIYGDQLYVLTWKKRYRLALLQTKVCFLLEKSIRV